MNIITNYEPVEPVKPKISSFTLTVTPEELAIITFAVGQTSAASIREKCLGIFRESSKTNAVKDSGKVGFPINRVLVYDVFNNMIDTWKS